MISESRSTCLRTFQGARVYLRCELRTHGLTHVVLYPNSVRYAKIPDLVFARRGSMCFQPIRFYQPPGTGLELLFALALCSGACNPALEVLPVAGLDEPDAVLEDPGRDSFHVFTSTLPNHNRQQLAIACAIPVQTDLCVLSAYSSAPICLTPTRSPPSLVKFMFFFSMCFWPRSASSLLQR